MRFFSFCIFFLLHCVLWAEDPMGLYLTWKESPETTMCIQWVSSQKDPLDTLWYQQENGKEWSKVEGKHISMPAKQPYFIHFVELKNLQPETPYNFKIGEEKTLYKFRTLPSEDPQSFRFVVGGDMYNGTAEMLEKTNKVAAAKDPLFVVIGGDIAYSCAGSINNKENAQKWLDWLDIWKRTMVSPDGFLIPIVPTIGNHEVRGGKDGTPNEAEFFFALFPFPGIEGYNVLDFGNYMSFIILDSGHTNPISGTQKDWLREVLKERRFMPHKYAIYHIPAYPSFRKYYSKASWSIRQHWVPLFERFGLTAAFENNDHAYKRTHPILRGKTNSKGILYMGDGAWAVENVRKPKSPKQAWYIAKSAATRYFMLVTISDLKRLYQAYTPDGLLVDEVVQNLECGTSVPLSTTNFSSSPN